MAWIRRKKTRQKMMTWKAVRSARVKDVKNVQIISLCLFRKPMAMYDWLDAPVGNDTTQKQIRRTQTLKRSNSRMLIPTNDATSLQIAMAGMNIMMVSLAILVIRWGNVSRTSSTVNRKRKNV